VEIGDADSEAEEHAFDLVVEAFVDGEAAAFYGKGFNDGGLGAGVFLFEGHPGAELGNGGFGDGLVGVDEIGFGDLVFRAGEGFGEAGVVGEDDESRGGAVEATGEVEFAGPGLCDEIDDGFVFPICGGGENAGGFVKQDDSPGVSLEGFAGGGYVVELSNFDGAVGGDLTVENSFFVFQQLLCVTFSQAGTFG